MTQTQIEAKAMAEFPIDEQLLCYDSDDSPVSYDANESKRAAYIKGYTGGVAGTFSREQVEEAIELRSEYSTDNWGVFAGFNHTTEEIFTQISLPSPPINEK